MKTPLKFLFVIVICISQSCNRQELLPILPDDTTELSVTEIIEAYDKEMTLTSLLSRKGKSKSEKTSRKKIDWNNSVQKTLGNQRRLVIPFSLEEEIYTKLADSTMVSYSKSTWLVASKQKGNISFELITLLPDIESQQKNIRQFSGHVIVENLAGEFLGGYYKTGSDRRNIIQSKENLRTSNSCVYFDWYTCVSVGGVTLGCYYDYSLTYCQVDEDDHGSFGGMSLGWGTNNYWREDIGTSGSSDHSTTTNNADPGMEYEVVTDKDRIDLNKYFNCFENLPAHNASYKVRLCADVINNDDPNQLTAGTKPGHAFLIMTKTSDGNAVTQSFGFYPEKGKVSSFHQPVKSQVVDDGSSQHEYNAYVDLNISDEVTFNVLKNMAKSLGNSMQYDLDDFNCTDYVLEIVNAAVSDNQKIVVPDWIGPVSGINYGTTPNGLYKTIVEMKAQGKSNVGIGSWNAPVSKGPCD